MVRCRMYHDVLFFCREYERVARFKHYREHEGAVRFQQKYGSRRSREECGVRTMQLFEEDRRE